MAPKQPAPALVQMLRRLVAGMLAVAHSSPAAGPGEVKRVSGERNAASGWGSLAFLTCAAKVARYFCNWRRRCSLKRPRFRWCLGFVRDRHQVDPESAGRPAKRDSSSAAPRPHFGPASNHPRSSIQGPSLGVRKPSLKSDGGPPNHC